MSRFSSQLASIWYNAGDTESSMFAREIAESLQKARIVVQPPASVVHFQGFGHFGDPIKHMDAGVTVQSTKDDHSRSLADAIIKELSIRGFDAVLQKDIENREPQVSVNVEPRPEGPQGDFKLQADREAKSKKEAKRK